MVEYWFNRSNFKYQLVYNLSTIYDCGKVYINDDNEIFIQILCTPAILEKPLSH